MTRSRLIRARPSPRRCSSAASACAAPAAAVVAVYDPSAAIIVQEVPSGDLAVEQERDLHVGRHPRHQECPGHVQPDQLRQPGRRLRDAGDLGLPRHRQLRDRTDLHRRRSRRWVNKVKNLPNTWGYLSVKEPSWNRISAAEIRALYRSYRAADPAHKVMALFGDVPHFGTSRNPYTRGMANVVMVDWYPVETTNGTNSKYLTGASTWFPKVRSKVATVSPGVPVYLMVQTHKYLRPATHKKQRPTQAAALARGPRRLRLPARLGDRLPRLAEHELHPRPAARPADGRPG